jgi:hypothetical protein
MDGFEKIIVVIIAILVIFIAVAQFDMKKEHNEKVLKRQLAYKEFLDGAKMPGEWHVAYKQGVE